MTGHLAASCVVLKSRPRCPPSWWTRASPEHYSVHKPSEEVISSEVVVDWVVVDWVVEALVAADVWPSPIADSLPEVAEVRRFPVLASTGQAPVSAVAPTDGLPSSPGVLGGDLVPGPVLGFPPGSAGGLLASGSSGEPGVFSVPPGRSVSSGVWAAEAAKVEDGWTVVKGKKSRPSSHPSQMNLQSSKKGSKSKGKS